MKLCKECKHCSPKPIWGFVVWYAVTVIGLLFIPWILRDRWEFARCRRTIKSDGRHPVDGRVLHHADMRFCDSERGYGDCGPDARWFEPKVPS